MSDQIDFSTVSPEALRARGWRKWGASLILCPATALAQVPNGTKMWTIDGASIVKGRDYIDRAHGAHGRAGGAGAQGRGRR